MTNNTQEPQAVTERLETLEKQNRAILRSAIAVLLAISIVLLMGQSSTKYRGTGEKAIATERLVITDSAGRERASLGADKYGVRIKLMDSQGNDAIVLAADELGGPSIYLISDSAAATLGPDHLRIIDNVTRKGEATLTYTQGGPSLILEDTHGYAAVLGNGGLVTPQTGESRQTSAASLVLFGKEKKVIWKAP